MDDHSLRLGIRNVWGGEQPFNLSVADRRHHVQLIGTTGVGKTTLLKRMIVDDLLGGRAAAIFDPHGDLSEELLDLVPPVRMKDVLYFDPASADYPIGFNPLSNVPSYRRHLVVGSMVSALKHIWGESWGPRMQHILSNALAALTECQNVTLLSVGRMLVDDIYLRWVVKQVHDPAVIQFWTQEFSAWDRRFRAEATAPVLNKLGALTLAAPIRNVLGQVKSAIDPRWLMDHGKIFIANLSRGRLGLENSNLLGSLLVSDFGLAAMSRADIPFHERRDVTIYVDEFSTFASDAFAQFLSENRKYRCAMVLSCQYFSQIRPDVLEAILGNVGTLVSFRVGEKDAQILSRQFGGMYHPNTFTGLGNFEVIVKMLQNGRQLEPFLGRTLSDTCTVYGRREKLLRHCRERYAMPRDKIEERIERWMRGPAHSKYSPRQAR